MFRYIILALLLIHALIHLMGFVKKDQVSRGRRFFWLISSLLFFSALFVRHWWWPASLAILCSQWLIIQQWKEAKWGTIINIIILFFAWASFGFYHFESRFRLDTRALSSPDRSSTAPLLTENRIAHLPPPVQRYIRYSGAINKPIPTVLHISFEGRMRGKDRDWFPFRSEQYNRLDTPARYFFMKARMFNMMVPGYHAYHDGKAAMDIRLFGWISVVNKTGPELDQGETVTWLNDLCLFAPGALANPMINWEEIDSLHARAIVHTGKIKVSAVLAFNNTGQLVNFFSNDRYETNDNKFYPFSTPVKDNKAMKGYMINTYGEAIWYYPEGPFVYGQFHLKDLELK